eukprot:gene10679-1942_t
MHFPGPESPSIGNWVKSLFGNADAVTTCGTSGCIGNDSFLLGTETQTLAKSSTPSHQNLYLCGPVGTGKTMLMDLLFR